MAGRFTGKRYDQCALTQSTKQSTDPLELIMDPTKYVNCNNLCQPSSETFPRNTASLVDIESSMWGLDKLASNCDAAKHPFCGPSGCLLTSDPRVGPHMTPYVCERGLDGSPAVVTTNMRMPTNPGFHVPNQNICGGQRNGFYASR